MLAKEPLTLVVGIITILFVTLISIPAGRTIVARCYHPKRSLYQSLGPLYQDQDGSATEESSDAFSDRFQRSAISLLSLLGLLTSLAIAVLATATPASHLSVPEQWMTFAVWGLLLLQGTSLAVEPVSTKRFLLGLYKATSCTLLFIMICTQIWSTQMVQRWHLIDHSYLALFAIQLVACFLGCCISLLLPRRPDVFRDGKLVDRQFTVSGFGRVMFVWAGPLLNLAAKQRRLEMADLPELDHETRAKTLREAFDAAKKPGELLWRTLYRIYVWKHLLQVVLTCVCGTLSFVPHYCLFRILRALESRGTDFWNPMEAWAWVIFLGCGVLLESSIESWLYWLAQSQMAIPVFEQLSAVVFAKSMRRKDVKGAQKPEERDGTLSKINTDGDDDDEMKKTRQATVNHVAVDALRIADFATYNPIIVSTILKISITIVFLTQLIGWKSLGSGLLVLIFITPLNISVAKKYSATQTTLMKLRDRKMAVITEALQGIRQIKFSALERQWEQKIFEVRHTELQAQWRAFVYDILLIMVWIIGPVMLSAVSLGVYSLLYGDLTPSVAFTTISIFTAMEFSLAILPELISEFIEAYISSGRIEKYLRSAERINLIEPGDEICLEKASVIWPAEDLDDGSEQFVLRNLNIRFPSKGLSIISGQTGSGKSLLLAALLGEAEIIEGVIRAPLAPPVEDRFDERATKLNWIVDSAIAYVAQVPWIENASIKDNILFGLPLDEQRYQKVIFACALEKDFEMLTDGELTDIGANGINLSGGQKWRVSFARALYSRAGILVMDDIFSALDAHTGRHLHVHALTGELCEGRTRILVTHHVGLCLPQADYSVHLHKGTIQHAGPVTELKQTGILTEILAEEENREEERMGDEIDSKVIVPGNQSVAENASVNTPESNGIDSHDTKAPKIFTQAENREIGSIKLANYVKYFRSGGNWFYWIAVFGAFVLYATLGLGRSWWVNIWTKAGNESSPEHKLQLTIHVTSKISSFEPESNNLWFYLGIYLALSVLSCIVGALRYAVFLWAAVRASRTLFQRLTYVVLRAPLRWLDTVPMGRILNRFTADFNMIDSRLPYDFSFLVYNVLQVTAILTAGLFVSPLLLGCAIPLLLICLYYSQRFLAGAREVKRLESTAKSPIYEQFGSALMGLGTIRAFGKAQAYVDRMYGKIDAHAKAYWNLWLFNRWLGIRMSVVGAIFSTATAALIVSIDDIDASLAGFALSFALEYTLAVTWTLRRYANVELDMNATERVLEYSSLEMEDQGGSIPPAAWPTEGRLEVSDLVVSYAPDLPPVLHGLSFTVEKNQRVGVVGRTGAGKSSLTLALFRFLEARSGSIYIDGIDVSKIRLVDLRSRLAIIPQDPVLFSGTIRSNLDPFEEYSDAELKDALQRVHLVSTPTQTPSPSIISPLTKNCVGDSETGALTTGATNSSTSSTIAEPTDNDTNKNIFKSLYSTISEGGLNLSQGQRQLLCLARAIVSRPKLMVLDEATSAVDMSTDALIQQSIRSEFGRNSTTLLVIAHRLSTIADFDRILVMDAGKAVEFGSPKELMGIERGVFRGLVKESGERELLEKMILG
ncbi:hypothetical protein FQN57_000828 [Myotisia sp. PD_48]|nr:hypothetical protein FQN57_000828 [Myotisia sp. PD_48]